MNEEPGMRSGDASEDERLREEIKRLQGELAIRESRQRGTRERAAGGQNRTRNTVSLILLIVGLVSLLIAIPVLWLNRTILTTDGWVDAVGPLADDPAVQEVVANAAADEYSRQVNTEQLVRDQLPEQSKGLAGPIAALIEMGIRQVARVVVSSDVFAGIWTEANRLGHSLAIAGLNQVQEVDGQLIERAQSYNIDLRSIIEALQRELQKRGINFNIPENIEARIPILQTAQLSRFYNYVVALNTAAPWISFLAVVAIAGAIGLSLNRRKTLFYLGAGIVIAGLVLLITDSIVKMRIISGVPSDAVFTPEATSQAFDTVTSGLISACAAAILLGLFLLAGAYALGPSPSMVRMRRNVRLWIYELGGNRAPGRVGLWIRAHRNLLQVGILILAAIALILPVNRTVAYIIWLAAGVVLLEFLVEFFGRTAPPPAHA